MRAIEMCEMRAMCGICATRGIHEMCANLAMDFAAVEEGIVEAMLDDADLAALKEEMRTEQDEETREENKKSTH